MGRNRAATVAAIGGLSCAGIVVAHHLAYLFASGGGSHQHELLENTGHGHWPYFVGMAMGLLLAGFAAFGRTLAGAGERPTRHLSVSGLALRLLVFQSLGFLALEAAERGALSGVGAMHLLEEPAVMAGLALQAVVALAGAMLLVAFAHLVTLVSTSRDHDFVTPTAYLFPLIASLLPARHEVATGSGTLRGPPT